MTHLSRSLVLGCSVLALAACGPEDLGSPGANGDIIIGDIDNSTGGGNGGTPAPTPGGVTPADGCPTIGADALLDSGTITGPTGEYRVCTLPSVFSESAKLPYTPGVLYAMNGRVDIGTDDGPAADASDGITGVKATLTIDPGVIVYAATGRSYLVAQRGSQLVAEGTVDRPIIFTSRDNVLGLNNANSSSQWGGVVLLGRAPVSDCSSVAANPANPIDCQQELEGALNPPSYGGITADDSSGSLAYVQIRYSGFTLAPNNELQSLTTGGVGSKTGISYIQSYNSSDDGVELFGGVVNMDHFIVIGAEDDSYDIDTGSKASIQYALAVQRAGAGDRVLELDSGDGDYTFDALPRTNAMFTNFTFIAQGSASEAILARGRADLNMSNGIVVKDGKCATVNEEDNAAAGSRAEEMGPPIFNSVLFSCTVEAGSNVEGYITGGTDNVVGHESTLTNLFVNGASEMAAKVFDPSAVSSFFQVPTFVGAIGADDTWHNGWTCNSATADLGGASSCLTLPVYTDAV